MKLFFAIIITFYEFAYSMLNEKLTVQSRDLTPCRKTDIISGYDMRISQDKYFDLNKHKENIDNTQLVQKLLKYKLGFQDRFFLGNKYNNNPIRTVNIKNGGLFDDFDDCF